MEIAKVYVNRTTCEVSSLKPIPAGAIGLKILVDYDDIPWGALQKTAVFQGCVTRDILNVEKEIIIPAEVIANPCQHLYIGIYGVTSNGDLAIPTLWADLGRVKAAANPSEDESTDPTLPVWAQLQANTADLHAQMNSNKNAIEQLQLLGPGTASLIVNKVTDKNIVISDSRQMAFQSLRIFGKTTQNGTPSPEAPIPLESVGNAGSVVVTVCGKNLFDRSLSSDQMTDLSGGYFTQLLDIGKGNTVSISFDKRYSAGERVGYIKILSGDTVSALKEIDWMYHQTVNALCKQQLTLTLPGDFLAVAFVNSSHKWAKDVLQIEIASAATAYEPYQGTQTLTCANPNGLPGIPVASGGNYTDKNGQQWVCDELVLANGVYVQRIGKIDSYAGEEITGAYMSSTGSLSGGATVLYALAESSEIPLTAKELTQYAALHTNYPNTTILNDGGAVMEVQYVADTKLYIDQKFAQLAAVLINNV